jgi:hypothetical protein
MTLRIVWVVLFGKLWRDGFFDHERKAEWLLPFVLEEKGWTGRDLAQWMSMLSRGKAVEGQGVTSWQMEVIDMDLSDSVHKFTNCLEGPGAETSLGKQ